MQIAWPLCLGSDLALSDPLITSSCLVFLHQAEMKSEPRLVLSDLIKYVFINASDDKSVADGNHGNRLLLSLAV